MGDIIVKRCYNSEKRIAELYLDDCKIAETDYNKTGWNGLELIKEISNNLAKYFGVTVSFCDTGGDDEDDNV